ncbi:Putative bromodomain associated domain, histone-fold [Septoria linicola]|uniref:Bromodomain associated domain, histone-fold n=1 Tax=Septoria linicola TaxID=215465 RepID=A0A9Q9AFJ2_9PEZI|nr:putative bromodomain associated domain, histone-fold [Septoria linicola]USW48112.1 Putative bromodomain associated domain, histone-fold [Septoria linicola]
MSQAHDLHRALLRPVILHTLRAAGFHSTKPSVLDTLVNLAERYLILLASTTAQHATSSHNDPVPTLTDVRMALSECGVLIPLEGAAQEAWKERMRLPLSEMALIPKGGEKRVAVEKRKRDEEDTRDVREFTKWYDSSQYREIKRVAGLEKDTGAVVGVGGSVVKEDDFFTALKKKHSKSGDDSRFQGTVLGRPADEKDVLLEGGPYQRVQDWRPRLEKGVHAQGIK